MVIGNNMKVNRIFPFFKTKGAAIQMPKKYKPYINSMIM